MKNHKWIKWVIVAIIVLLLAGGVFWLIKTDKMSVKFGAAAGDTFTPVCGDEMRRTYFEEYSKIDQDKDKMKSIYDEVVSKKDYMKDPNCVYVAYTYNTTFTRDKAAARTDLDALKEMSKGGINTDSKFTNIPSWDLMQSTVNAMAEPGAESDGIG